MSKKNTDIYKMKLHERIWIGIDVFRVAGGWVYSDYNVDTDTLYNSIFIPFNNEFHNE